MTVTAGLLQSDVSTIAEGINVVWVLTVSFLIFFMQPGFALLEAGQVRAKNVANVFMKNIADWSLGVLVYFLLGLGVAGATAALTSPEPLTAAVFAYVGSPESWIAWLFGAVFAMTAATITSGAVAGRIRFSAYVVYVVAVTAVIYPVVQGAVFGGGLLAAEGYLGRLLGVGYLDFAGGTVVHMVGGVAGLVGAWLLGPRRDRFDADGDSRAIPGHSVLLAMLGTFVLAFGWYGFNVGTQATILSEGGTLMERELARVALNTTLGMGAGTVAAAVVTTLARGRPDPLFTANGLLAGLVGVTSAAAYVTWWGGLVIGAVGGALVYPTYQWVLEGLQVDDVVAVFSVHGVPGAIGAVAIPFFGVTDAGAWTFLGVDQVVMQLAGVVTIAGWTVLTTWLVLAVTDRFVGLRVDEAAEAEGLDRSEHEISAYPEFAADGGVASATTTPPGTGGDTGGMKWRGQTVEQHAAVGRLFEQFLDARTGGGFVVDETNTIDAVDETARELFGLSPEELVGTRPVAAVDDDRGDDATHLLGVTDEFFEPADSLGAASRGEPRKSAPVDWEPRVGVVDERSREGVVGDGRAVTATATPVVADDSLSAVVVTLTDVTERRRTEAYREAALDSHHEKLARFADGELAVEPGVPEPETETPRARAFADTAATLDETLLEAVGQVETIVERLPDQSAELATRSETLEARSEAVRTAAAEIDDRSTAIGEAAATLADRTETADQTVAELSASMEEVGDSARETRETARAVTEQTDQSVAEATAAVERIRAATTASRQVVTEIDELAATMREVEATVETIRSVAEQTNLLALNANIEAARATDGDTDGFAVVAQEIRTLAEETHEAVEEVDDTVTAARTQTDGVVDRVQEANEEIEAGADAVERVADEIEAVGRQVETATDGMEEIDDEVQRQTKHTREIGDLVEDVAATAERLATLAADISQETTDQSTATSDVAATAARLSELAAAVHEGMAAFEAQRGVTNDQSVPVGTDDE
jgi:Amt family ammonium transporter